MASRKKKDRGKKREDARKRRAKRLARRRSPEPIAVVAPPGVEKMSHVLEKFIEPYVGESDTVEEKTKLLTIGMVAWNAAVSEGSKREELLHDVLATLPAEDRDQARQFLLELIERKERHFAHNTRLIIDFTVFHDSAGLPQLNVVSTLPTR